MQAWAFDGSPVTCSWTTLSRPALGPREVRVRVVTSALNHVDVWLSAGVLTPRLPHVPGCDAAGVVDEIGSEVTTVSVGDEVVVNPAISCGRCPPCLAGRPPLCRAFHTLGDTRWGTHAEELVVPDVNVTARPQTRSWDESAAFGLTTLTAWRMLRLAGLCAGDTVLVVGIGGGVSCSALLLAKWSGARVVVTSRSAAKRERALQLGADEAIDSAAPRWGVRADIVIESVGAATWEKSIRSLAPAGRIAVCGATSGPTVEVNLVRLFMHHQTIIGSTMGTHEEWAEVCRLFASGLPVAIDEVLPLSDYPSGLARLAAGEQFGKLVLRHDA
ncbi:MAG: hypothetical protein ABT15_05445 [Pseudonocardia sp. SCN 73-27]|nr:MAG: hypothetical protein ABS80_00955 [Pseudonocardia sp. SCN 72-51]ODV08227.1 MAG: hypothetical protein ABT15_05445 [Pseudonocardia sp. SCN 73-27]